MFVTRYLDRHLEYPENKKNTDEKEKEA
jgi:hypothetical protein